MFPRIVVEGFALTAPVIPLFGLPEGSYGRSAHGYLLVKDEIERRLLRDGTTG